jgi:hypothetical protein
MHLIASPSPCEHFLRFAQKGGNELGDPILVLFGIAKGFSESSFN